MTSTSTFKGMDTDSKPSSRVLAPPGGGSSNIFGFAEPAQAPPKKEPAAPPKPAEPAPAQQANQGDRYVRAAPKQAFNPITGQPYDMPEQKKQETAAAEEDSDEKTGKENEKKADVTTTKSAAEPKEKTSTRIAQPPGGKSSGLW